MRVEDIFKFLMNAPDRIRGFIIIYAFAADEIPNLLVVVTEQLENANKVAGVAYIHRVGISCLGLCRLKFTAVDIPGKYIIAVACCNEMPGWQSRNHSQQSCTDIAEISTRHADHGRHIMR